MGALTAVLSAVVAPMAVLVTPMAVLAAPAAAATSAGAPAAASVPVMIVLDASGSMNQDDAPGPRIDAARTAVTDLLGTLPAAAKVGLMVYGTGTGSTDAEKATGCQDIKTLAPVAPLDTATLSGQVESIVASGYTPIGNALKAAAAALPAEGPRSIVLVSDGEDTCAPPAPCDVARELHQQGVDLTVHTVGFKVDATARDQLSCVAQATGGTYSDAGDATGLTGALQAKVEVAITGYTTAGTPVTGADQASEQAPLLTPGQYVDTYAFGGTTDMAAAGTTKYYTIPVQAGMRPYISATIVPPDQSVGDTEIFGLDVDLLRSDLTSCAHERGSAVLDGNRSEAPTAVVDGPTFGSPQGRTCPTEGVAILKVARIGQAWADQPVSVEIVVRMEPPADASGVLPPATKGAVLPAPTHGTPTALTGGNSFNDAPRLTSGTTYADTLTTGESRYYRVPLHWGQRFTYLITEVGPAQPALDANGAIVWVDVFNPVRAEVTRLVDTDGRGWFTRTVDDKPFSSSTEYLARYTNRAGGESREFSLDGDYFLRVNANRNEDQTSSTAFLITVVVSGDVEPGPVYLAAGTMPTSGGSTPPSTRASTSAASDSVSGSVSGSGTPADATGLTAQGTPAESPVPGWIWALGGALVATAVAVLVVLFSRRRAAGGRG
jgi:Ca-activated chloride channel family protein